MICIQYSDSVKLSKVFSNSRNIIRSTLLGVFIVTLTYVGMNAAYTTALSVDDIIHGTAVAVVSYE